jgi:hypothetical protein
MRLPEDFPNPLARSALRLAVGLAVVGALGACGRKTQQATGRDTMTQRQKDSALGASKIPGAQGVQKALQASDSASARMKALDSIQP